MVLLFIGPGKVYNHFGGGYHHYLKRKKLTTSSKTKIKNGVKYLDVNSVYKLKLHFSMLWHITVYLLTLNGRGR